MHISFPFHAWNVGMMAEAVATSCSHAMTLMMEATPLKIAEHKDRRSLGSWEVITREPALDYLHQNFFHMKEK